MKDTDRIRLAEFVGGPRWEAYINPGAHPESVSLPDPENDRYDCDALIAKLNEQGYEVDVLHWKEGDACVLLKSDFNLRHGEVNTDKCKQGVCELALEVI